MAQEGASTNGADTGLLRVLETLKGNVASCNSLISSLLEEPKVVPERQEDPSPVPFFEAPLEWVNACLEQKNRAPLADSDLPRSWERWSVSLWGEEVLLPGAEGRGRVFLVPDVADGQIGVVIPDPWWLRSDYHGFLSRGGDDLKTAYARAFECVAPFGYAWSASYHLEDVARVRRSSQGGWEVVQRGKLEFRPM